VPQFNTGEVKSARVTFTNPKAQAVTLTAILFIGTDMIAIGQTNFVLTAGQSKEVTISVGFPTTPGTYPIYIGVFYGGVLVQLFHAIEDVVLAEAMINLEGFLKVVTVNGIRMGSVGIEHYISKSGIDRGTLPYGVAKTPLLLPSFSGLNFDWLNTGVYWPENPVLASNEHVKMRWWLAFMLVDDYLITPEPTKLDPNPSPDWVSNIYPAPTYMIINNYGGGVQVPVNSVLPAVGGIYNSGDLWLHSGGSGQGGHYDLLVEAYLSDIHVADNYFAQKQAYFIIKNALVITG